MQENIGFVNGIEKTSIPNQKLNTRSNVLGQSDFIKLFIEQLKRQDPLEPLKDKEFISQISQFSNLEQVVQLNNKLQVLINKNSNLEFFNLLGKKITWLDKETNSIKEGIVSSLEKENGQFFIKVDNKFSVDQNSILTVKRG